MVFCQFKKKIFEVNDLGNQNRFKNFTFYLLNFKVAQKSFISFVIEYNIFYKTNF